MIPGYYKYWGIDAPAFSRVTMPDELFIPASRLSYLEHLVVLSGQDQTQLIIHAPSGYGKTCTVRWLQTQLPNHLCESLLIFTLSTSPTPTEVLPRINDYLIGKSHVSDSLFKATTKGFQHLREENRGFTLVIDGIDGSLDAKISSELRFLFELAEHSGTRFSAILSSNKPLGRSMESLPNLASRTAIEFELGAFSKDETLSYISWKLGKSSIPNGSFTEKAVAEISELSEGVPRKINILSDMCLSLAFVEKKKQIDSEIVELAGQRFIQSKYKYTASEANLEKTHAPNSEADPKGHSSGRQFRLDSPEQPQGLKGKSLFEDY